MIVEWDVGDLLGLGFGILTDLGALLDVCGYDASIIRVFGDFVSGKAVVGESKGVPAAEKLSDRPTIRVSLLLFFRAELMVNRYVVCKGRNLDDTLRISRGAKVQFWSPRVPRRRITL